MGEEHITTVAVTAVERAAATRMAVATLLTRVRCGNKEKRSLAGEQLRGCVGSTSTERGKGRAAVKNAPDIGRRSRHREEKRARRGGPCSGPKEDFL